MKSKNLDTLRAYRRWFSGRGAKYQSCLPPSISVEDVKKSFEAACDAMSLRLSVQDFSALTKGAETTLERFTKNRREIQLGMDDKASEEFERFCSALKAAVRGANRILRTVRKNGHDE